MIAQYHKKGDRVTKRIDIMPSGYKMVYIYDELGREIRYIEYDLADRVLTY